MSPLKKKRPMRPKLLHNLRRQTKTMSNKVTRIKGLIKRKAQLIQATILLLKKLRETKQEPEKEQEV